MAASLRQPEYLQSTITVSVVETVPEQEPSPSGAPKRLLWILGILAFASTAVAAMAWTQGRDSIRDVPDTVSLQDLGAADLASNDPAPDFTVPTLDGVPFTLSSHLADTGTPVILNFWASWCAPCRAEMPALDAAAARHPSVKFVGVAVQDDNQAAEDFARELGVSYTIGLDERDVVNALYPSFGLPVTYIISPEGIILQSIFGEVDEPQLDALIATYFGG